MSERQQTDGSYWVGDVWGTVVVVALGVLPLEPIVVAGVKDVDVVFSAWG